MMGDKTMRIGNLSDVPNDVDKSRIDGERNIQYRARGWSKKAQTLNSDTAGMDEEAGMDEDRREEGILPVGTPLGDTILQPP